MVIYGTKIISDRAWRHRFPERGDHAQSFTLLEGTPEWAAQLTRREHLQYTHGHETYLLMQPDDPQWQPSAFWAYEIEELGGFFVERESRKVYARWEGGEMQMEFWLSHLLLPLWLALETGALLLHAGAVEIEGKAVVFCAPSHGGKSTLTDDLVARGHRLITDDTLALFPRDGGFVTTGSVPYCRPYREFETLGEYTPEYRNGWIEVSQLYLLERDDGVEGASFVPVVGIEKFSALHEGTLLYNFPHLRARHLRDLAAFLDGIRVTRLRRPWGREHFPRLHGEILSHMRGRG